MIYVSCSDEEYLNFIELLSSDDTHCPFPVLHCTASCYDCCESQIKRINTDITPENPNYNTEAENTAFLQGFNVAVKRMRGDTK